MGENVGCPPVGTVALQQGAVDLLECRPDLCMRNDRNATGRNDGGMA
jgi:hypothetical protein